MNIKIFLYLQSLTLTGGTVFAWFTVFTDFSRFFNAGHEITTLTGYVPPNPLVTPCFYGAIAFLIALGLSINVILSKAKNLTKHQKRLNYLLIAGSLFAWGNVAYEFYKYFQATTEEYIGCSGHLVSSPFETACFIGACVYLAALVVSVIILKTKK